MEKIFDLIKLEKKRQLECCNLIASENLVSDNVRKALGSILSNKYAEGYPGKRYYAGCQYVDEIENLAIDTAKQLFGVEYVNVQPHSGSHANQIVYFALLNPGDTIMGMEMKAGGHLTHGSKVNFSGILYQVVTYGLCPDKYDINYQEIEEKMQIHHPKLFICGASSYCGDWNYQLLKEICQKHNCLMLADISHTAGLIVSGLLNNPVEYADIITTTTHKTLRGPRGAIIMAGKDKLIHGKLLSKIIDSATFPGMSGGPQMHTIAAKAVCFLEALQPSFIAYARQVVNHAVILENALNKLGFKTFGTKNHIVLVDLSEKNITGLHAEQILANHKIYLNKNLMPNDTKSPFVTSGIRIGTSFMTSLGYKDDDFRKIANDINELLSN